MLTIKNLSRHSWMLVLLVSLCLLLVFDRIRYQRIEQLSALGVPKLTEDARSPTGYANGRRRLVIPERIEESFKWIEQTQQMFSEGTPWVTHVDYENAPDGRDELAPSPYRWWLGCLAWVDHVASGRPVGISVERAALIAGPLFQAILLCVATILVALFFGSLPGSLVCLALLTFYPFAGAFLPGVPDSQGVACALGFAGVLVLFVGVAAAGRPGRVAGRPGGLGIWFAVAGAIGGSAAWVSLAAELPILLGIVLAVSCASIAGRKRHGTELPWRVWSLAGALTILLGYIAECYPSRLGAMRLDWLNPVYGLAWLGAGELLVAAGRLGGKSVTTGRMRGAAVIAAGFTSVILLIVHRDAITLVFSDLSWARLSNLPGSPVARSIWTWAMSGGALGALLATLAPLSLLACAFWLAIRLRHNRDSLVLLAVTIGPAVLCLAFATQRLAWWAEFDGLALVCLIAAIELWPWKKDFPVLLTVFACLAGLAQLLPSGISRRSAGLSLLESEELIERNLAYWLWDRAGEPATIYAPPHESAGLAYFAPLRALGTHDPENGDGFKRTLVIADGDKDTKVRQLVTNAGIRFIVLPSWDPFFSNYNSIYVEGGSELGEGSRFVYELTHNNLPGWVRPLAYKVPKLKGFERQSVRVFETVNDQRPGLALSRLEDYFLEMGDAEGALAVGEALKKYPGDFAAVVARARAASTSDDSMMRVGINETLLSRLALGADRYLAWDMRVSLAEFLMQGKHEEAALRQMKVCLNEANEARLRSLSPDSLYRFARLHREMGLRWGDPKLEALELSLLPEGIQVKP